MRLSVVLASVLLATTTSLAVAQITTATISGTVKDQTGGVLPGVDIVLKNLDPLATAGQVTRTANTSRQIQLGIKILY